MTRDDDRLGRAREMQAIVGTWADKTFPASTVSSIVAHLDEEASELRKIADSYTVRNASRPDALAVFAEEAADVLLLLFHLAHKANFDLMDAMVAKFNRNQSRTWERPDDEAGVARGYWKHIEQAEAP